MQLDELARADVRAWRSWMVKKGASPYTANRAVLVLRAALGAAVEDGLIDANPAAGHRALPRPGAVAPAGRRARPGRGHPGRHAPAPATGRWSA